MGADFLEFAFDLNRDRGCGLEGNGPAPEFHRLGEVFAILVHEAGVVINVLEHFTVILTGVLVDDLDEFEKIFLGITFFAAEKREIPVVDRPHKPDVGVVGNLIHGGIHGSSAFFEVVEGFRAESDVAPAQCVDAAQIHLNHHIVGGLRVKFFENFLGFENRFFVAFDPLVMEFDRLFEFGNRECGDSFLDLFLPDIRDIGLKRESQQEQEEGEGSNSHDGSHYCPGNPRSQAFFLFDFQAGRIKEPLARRLWRDILPGSEN